MYYKGSTRLRQDRGEYIWARKTIGQRPNNLRVFLHLSQEPYRNAQDPSLRSGWRSWELL